MHHPTIARGEDRFLLQWSVEEAAPAFIDAGLVTPAEMDAIHADMERDTLNLDNLVLGPHGVRLGPQTIAEVICIGRHVAEYGANGPVPFLNFFDLAFRIAQQSEFIPVELFL